MTREDARTRVAQGAALLDQVRPGWYLRIDVGTLDLDHPCLCVIGQVIGNYNYSCEQFAASCGVPGHFEAHKTFVETHGFWAIGGDFTTLQDAWIEAIADRLVSSAQRSDAGRVEVASA